MKDTLKRELIGVEVKVTGSRNRANLGIEGRITDETRETLTIETEKGMKKLIKDNITIMIKKDGIRVKGSLLKGRPEERIKKK